MAVAGFSLGEYTALIFAGALSLEDGLRLVQVHCGRRRRRGVEKKIGRPWRRSVFRGVASRRAARSCVSRSSERALARAGRRRAGRESEGSSSNKRQPRGNTDQATPRHVWTEQGQRCTRASPTRTTRTHGQGATITLVPCCARRRARSYHASDRGAHRCLRSRPPCHRSLGLQ